MLHVLKTTMPGTAQALLTTTNQAFDRVAMHGVRREVLEAQARATGLPLRVVPLPWPCSNDDYEHLMLDASYAGRAFDRQLRAGLPPSADRCGEKGEFHTCVWDGPMFTHPVGVTVGEVVTRDGFVYADITLA